MYQVKHPHLWKALETANIPDKVPESKSFLDIEYTANNYKFSVFYDGTEFDYISWIKLPDGRTIDMFPDTKNGFQEPIMDPVEHYALAHYRGGETVPEFVERWFKIEGTGWMNEEERLQYVLVRFFGHEDIWNVY